MSRLFDDLDARVANAETLLSQIDSRDETLAIFSKAIDDRAEEINKNMKKQRQYFDKKIDDIFYEHLQRNGIIGTEEGCEADSLINYVLNKFPVLAKKTQTNTEQITQSNFLIKNF